MAVAPAPGTPFVDPLPSFSTLHTQRKVAALTVAREHRRRWDAASYSRRLCRQLLFPQHRERVRRAAAEAAAAAAAVDATAAIAEGDYARRRAAWLFYVAQHR